MFNDNIEYGNYTTIRGIDLCVILGNLIDNAIEAEEKEKVLP
nr:GHKL domain-containing protein [Catenibacillus scindens]